MDEYNWEALFKTLLNRIGGNIVLHDEEMRRAEKEEVHIYRDTSSSLSIEIVEEFPTIK